MDLLGQRRSFDGNLCTIRYVGEVAGTTGEWYGVEWDEPTRGKHSGEHKGVRYFTCKSNQPTAGSFVRPSRPEDKPRGFLDALREKYASEYEQKPSSLYDGALYDSIEISGKIVEEVGFDKVRKRLAQLQDLKIVLLDRLCIVGALSHGDYGSKDSARRTIATTCPKVIELDLSRNLLARWTDVADICSPLKRLKLLKLNGNRLEPIKEGLRFDGITELYLDETLLAWDEISALTYQFPSLTSLSASANQVAMLSAPISDTVTILKLEHNKISSLSSVQVLAELPRLEQLSLRGNYIDTVHAPGVAGRPPQFSSAIKFLDISRNRISSWSFINQLSSSFPGITSLRISGNPLYSQPLIPSPDTNGSARPMSIDEAYILTLSRMPGLRALNYGNVTAQDRYNGELYYLSLIGKELSAVPESAELQILAQHPRYAELCEKYGEPNISRVVDRSLSAGERNPRSVAASLIKMSFYLNPSRASDSEQGESMVVKEVPRSFNIYQIKAIVSRLFGLPPFQFKLIWETEELDPVSGGPEDSDWDSGEDYGRGDSTECGSPTDRVSFVKREIELVDSTRDIGVWIYGDRFEARIRVEGYE